MTPLTSATALKEVAQFLENRCGLVFAESDLPSLGKKIEERLVARGCPSVAAYLALINSAPGGTAELKELLNRVTINETFFYRIPSHFRVFSAEMLPALAEARRAERKLRVWSAGCSTGEEVYSLAIEIAEFPLFHGWDVRVVGTDISEGVVEKARRGIYRGRSIQSVPANLLSKYFSVRPDGHAATDTLKALCEFKVHNLVADPPPDRHFDVVFFRNVMIYFQASTTRRIMETFHRLIPDDGYLVIGPAETLWQISDRFHPHFRGDSFIYRKFPDSQFAQAAPSAPDPASPTPKPAPAPLATKAPAAPLPPRPVLRPVRDALVSATVRDRLKMAEDFLASGGYPEALNILETLPEDQETLFLRGESLLAMGRYRAFLELKDLLLERDPLHVEVRYLHALYLSNQGEGFAAREEIQRILFIDENLLLPRYTLMLLHEREGRRDKARQECRNLVRIIEAGRGGEFRRRLHARPVKEAEILRHCRERLPRDR